MRSIMKTLLLTSLLLLSNYSLADESRTYKKISSVDALIEIKTEEQDSTQAAAYVDAQENDRFIQELLKDKESPLSQLKTQIELSNCETTSTEENDWIDGCGEVTITKSVRTSFGRGGWQSAGAAYTFFVGFTSDGTGRFFDVSHMVTITETAEAQIDAEYNCNGTVHKFLSLDTIVELERKAAPSLK